MNRKPSELSEPCDGCITSEESIGCVHEHNHAVTVRPVLYLNPYKSHKSPHAEHCNFMPTGATRRHAIEMILYVQAIGSLSVCKHGCACTCISRSDSVTMCRSIIQHHVKQLPQSKLDGCTFGICDTYTMHT